MRCGGGDCGELVVGSVSSSRADINYLLRCYIREIIFPVLGTEYTRDIIHRIFYSPVCNATSIFSSCNYHLHVPSCATMYSVLCTAGTDIYDST